MDRGKARNEGIKVAKGKYVMFLDSDDYIEKNNLQEVINQYLKNEKYDVLYYDFEW